MKTTLFVTSLDRKQRRLLQPIIRPLVDNDDISLGLTTCEINTTSEIADQIVDQLTGWRWKGTLVHRYNWR